MFTTLVVAERYLGVNAFIEALPLSGNCPGAAVVLTGLGPNLSAVALTLGSIFELSVWKRCRLMSSFKHCGVESI